MTAFGTAAAHNPDGQSSFAVPLVGIARAGMAAAAGYWVASADGVRESHLGRMNRPKSFHPDGFAIHGATFVPPYQASHGCIRVSHAAIDVIWERNLAPIGSQFWVYGTVPAR